MSTPRSVRYCARARGTSLQFRIRCVRAWSVAIVAVLSTGTSLRAQAAQPAERDTLDHGQTRSWMPRVLGAQFNAIAQSLGSFRSPYSGSNSLSADGDHAVSHIYGVYFGMRPWQSRHARTLIDAYLDIEMVRGRGVSRTVGLGGPTNGDVIRQGSADLGSGPYVARAFVRVVHAFDPTHDVVIAHAPDQMASATSAHRIEVTAGKLAAGDLFDLNRYANSTRQQFMNWGLFQNTAWDYAADTRGYTNGIAVAWITPQWSIRAGSFQMPTLANGNVFDAAIAHARGDQLELTFTPALRSLGTHSPTVRLLAYVNQARMGRYRDALARAEASHVVPDIVADDQPGRRKRGWGISVEQPVADSGETGVWMRLGGNDGRTESFAFTEVDQHVSAGGQLSGTHWGRADDRVAAAVVSHGLSAPHRDYLAAGGLGFLLGDGRLAYAHEWIGEAYYRWQPRAWCQITADLQAIANPGYNRDRGPAMVSGVRVNVRY